MKEALGGISLFQIVIIFILLFTAVMCLTLNHAKAFGVKDEIINIIETDSLESSNSVSSHIDSRTSQSIADLLGDAGYRITGRCPNNDWVGYDRNGNVTSNNNAAFCIKSTDVAEAYYDDASSRCRSNCTSIAGDYPDMYYYEVVLFYQLDIPIIGGVFNFRIYGSTKVLFG